MLVICKNISILRIYEKQRSLKTLPCRRHYSRHSGWYKTVSFIPGPKVLPGLCVRPHGEVTNTEQLLQILKQAVQLVSATGVWEKPLWQVPSWVVPWRPRYALIGLSRGDVHGVPKKRVCVWWGAFVNAQWDHGLWVRGEGQMQQVNESYVVRWSLKWFGRRLEATQKSLAGLKHRVSGKGYMQGVKDACDFS